MKFVKFKGIFYNYIEQIKENSSNKKLNTKFK